MNSPSDEELLEAVTKLRPIHPHLGRLKLLSLLKETHSWTLSEQRLKKCLDKNNLNTKPENEDAALQPLPRDAKFGDVVKDAFIDFKTRERNFFLALSGAQSRKASDGDSSDPMYATCHMRHHVEFLLTLKEIKPCTLFVHGTAQDLFTEMVQKCLKPVVEKYKLARYGFHLQQITHQMPTTAHHGFQNGWVFADTRSSLWPEVNYLFLTPNTRKADEDRIGKALGYPIDSAIGRGSTFRAVDYTEMDDIKAATHKEVCCVSAFEFFCGTGFGHFKDLMVHYNKCMTAAEDVGTLLKVDLSGHRELEAWVTRIQSGAN